MVSWEPDWSPGPEGTFSTTASILSGPKSYLLPLRGWFWLHVSKSGQKSLNKSTLAYLWPPRWPKAPTSLKTHTAVLAH